MARDERKISLYLPVDLLNRTRDAAEKMDTNVSRVIRNALIHYFGPTTLLIEGVEHFVIDACIKDTAAFEGVGIKRREFFIELLQERVGITVTKAKKIAALPYCVERLR